LKKFNKLNFVFKFLIQKNLSKFLNQFLNYNNLRQKLILKSKKKIFYTLNRLVKNYVAKQKNRR